MALNIIQTKRGKPKLEHDGFLYVSHKCNKEGNLKFWRCQYFRSKDFLCRGRVHSDHQDKVIATKGVHTCPSSAEDIAVQRVKTAIKRRATETMETPSELCANVLSGIPAHVLAQIPQKQAIKQMVRRARQSEDTPRRVPAPSRLPNYRRKEDPDMTEIYYPPEEILIMNKQISDHEEKTLIEEALNAQQNAYCPYSKFRVGAALLTHEGYLFKGANVENASYGATICAERSAICAAIGSVGAANFRIKAIAVVADLPEPASPCGICRQVLAEFGDFPVLLYSRTTKKLMFSSVHELLPMAFTPDNLEEYNKGKMKNN